MYLNVILKEPYLTPLNNPVLPLLEIVPLVVDTVLLLPGGRVLNAILYCFPILQYVTNVKSTFIEEFALVFKNLIDSGSSFEDPVLL